MVIRPQPVLWTMVAVAFFAVGMLSSDGLSLLDHTERPYPSRPLQPDVEPVLRPQPPVDDEYFPCDDCHEDEPAELTVRELDEHDETELEHGDLWCLDCHDPMERDLLHLSDTSPVEMLESWRLCTRCHGNKLDDWRAGVHGKRTGYWRGPKEYRTCVECHEPHSPVFKPLEPMPTPMRARDIRRRARARVGGRSP